VAALCRRSAFHAHRPIILGTISLDLFAVLLGGVVALLPVYAHEVLQVGPQGLGLLRSSMAAGEVCMGLWLASRPINRRVGKVMFAAVAVFGLANLVFALSHWFVLSMLALAVAGAADMVSVYIRGALVQFSTPDHMRGRVNAVNMLFIGSSNELGEFRAGSSVLVWRSSRRHSGQPVHAGRGGRLDDAVQAAARCGQARRCGARERPRAPQPLENQ
jgi:MFS family permease